MSSKICSLFRKIIGFCADLAKALVAGQYNFLLSRRFFPAFFLFLSLLFLISCATPFRNQSRVNGFVATNNYTQASSLLNDNPNFYGRKNTLLYFLDKGYVLHLAKDYNKSIDTFEKAKRKFDELYTKSVTGIIGTWAVNDYMAPYRGEDFERVMINVFQSLNYSALGNLEDALVEAREVDSKLHAINNRYKPNEKNVYKEDAFARLLMGILYEANMTKEDFNNAFISYAKAVEIYEKDYNKNYGIGVPELLKENILAAAQFMGPAEFGKYTAKYGNVRYSSLEKKAKKAEVYLIQYNGFSPVKSQVTIPIPLPDGYIIQLAFPKYEPRFYQTESAFFTARGENNKTYKSRTQLGENISAIAKENLENRKVRVIAKAIATSAGKYLIERKEGETIRKKYGDGAEAGFKILSDLFNIFSSRADLRSWQTLPSEIRIARLLLEPGEYTLSVTNLDSQNRTLNEIDLGKVTVIAGQKIFFIVRSVL